LPGWARRATPEVALPGWARRATPEVALPARGRRPLPRPARRDAHRVAGAMPTGWAHSASYWVAPALAPQLARLRIRTEIMARSKSAVPERSSQPTAFHGRLSSHRGAFLVGCAHVLGIGPGIGARLGFSNTMPSPGCVPASRAASTWSAESRGNSGRKVGQLPKARRFAFESSTTTRR
jgi:hypothetical protein